MAASSGKPPPREVESKVIRELVDASGVSLYEIACRLGATTRREKADGVSRLCRMLGITTYTKVWISDDERKRGTYRQQSMSRENALRIVRALGLEPVDVPEADL